MYVTMSCQLFDKWMCIFTEQFFFSILVRSVKSLSVFYFIIMHTNFIHCTVWKFLLCCNFDNLIFFFSIRFVILMFFYWPSVLFQFTLFLNDIKSNSDSATSKHSDKNAKLREGSKNTHPPVKQLTRHSHIHVHFISRVVLRTWRYHHSST